MECFPEEKQEKSFSPSREGITWFPEEGDEDHDEGQACEDAHYYRHGPPNVILRIILSPKEDQDAGLE
jgi:hypothetical protein